MTAEGVMAHRHRPQDWLSADYVESWLARDAQRAAQHEALFTLMCGLLPFAPDDRFRFVDIGAGNGVLTAKVLDTFPRSTAACLDLSDVMLTHAGRTLARFGGRVHLARADIAAPGWTAALSDRSPDAVLSSRAIHNLYSARRIQRVYRQIAELLPDHGVFVDADHVGPHAALTAHYGRASATRAAMTSPGQPDPGRHAHAGHGGDTGSHLTGGLEEHLRWLRGAGFRAADCPWRDLTLALLIAEK